MTPEQLEIVAAMFGAWALGYCCGVIWGFIRKAASGWLF